MPPVQALAALHGAWFVLLVPPTVWVMRRWPAERLRLTGVSLTTTGLLFLAAVAGRDLLIWFSWAPPEYQRYFGQRILFAITTATDLPLIQLTVAGMACWIVGKRRWATRNVPSADPYAHARVVHGSEASERAEDRPTILPN